MHKSDSTLYSCTYYMQEAAVLHWAYLGGDCRNNCTGFSEEITQDMSQRTHMRAAMAETAASTRTTFS